jgi:CheY-like chemotaxis protein
MPPPVVLLVLQEHDPRDRGLVFLIGPDATVINGQRFEVRKHRERQLAAPGIAAELEGGQRIFDDFDSGLFGFEKEDSPPTDAKAVVRRLGLAADLNGVFVDDVLVRFSQPLLVVDVPAEGLEEGVEELAAELRFVVAACRLVRLAIALEVLDQLTKDRRRRHESGASESRGSGWWWPAIIYPPKVEMSKESVLGDAAPCKLPPGRLLLMVWARGILAFTRVVELQRLIFMAEKQELKEPAEKDEGAQKRILLVDDDHEIIESMRLALESRGYKILVARDGNQGLAMAEREDPDLLILDMMMPKRSGFLVLEKLRRSRPVPMRVIMITANEGSRHKAYAEMLGVDDYIRKPFAMDKLLESVGRLLEK